MMALALAVLFVVAGCSGGDDGGPSTPTTGPRGTTSTDGGDDGPASEDDGDRRGADHTSLLDAGTDDDADLLVAAAVAFLVAQLRAAPAGLDTIGVRAEASGGAEWRAKS
jgi:hypothetical protein